MAEMSNLLYGLPAAQKLGCLSRPVELQLDDGQVTSPYDLIWAPADRRQTHDAEEIRERSLRASDRIALFLARRAPRALRRLAAMAVQER